MAIPVQLIGGSFQDITGNLLDSGYLIMELSSDVIVNTFTAVGSQFSVKILLDSSGNVSTSSVQSVWPNDALTPDNTAYIVSVYEATGQLVWGPFAVRVLSSPSPFNIGVWIP